MLIPTSIIANFVIRSNFEQGNDIGSKDDVSRKHRMRDLRLSGEQVLSSTTGVTTLGLLQLIAENAAVSFDPVLDHDGIIKPGIKIEL